MSYITNIRLVFIKWYLEDLEYELEYSRSLSFAIVYIKMILLNYLISDHLNTKPWPSTNAANQGPNPKLSTCENRTAWSRVLQ